MNRLPHSTHIIYLILITFKHLASEQVCSEEKLSSPASSIHHNASDAAAPFYRTLHNANSSDAPLYPWTLALLKN